MSFRTLNYWLRNSFWVHRLHTKTSRPQPPHRRKKKIHLESLHRSRRLVDPTSERKLGKTHDFNDGFLTSAKTVILLNWSVLGISPFDEDDILTELPPQKTFDPWHPFRCFCLYRILNLTTYGWFPFIS